MKDILYLPHIFIGIMLIFLEVMQIFWSYYILASMVSVIKTKSLSAVNDIEKGTLRFNEKK